MLFCCSLAIFCRMRNSPASGVRARARKARALEPALPELPWLGDLGEEVPWRRADLTHPRTGNLSQNGYEKNIGSPPTALVVQSLTWAHVKFEAMEASRQVLLSD